MSFMLGQLFDLLNSITPLSDELKERISSIIKYKEFKKNAYLLEIGQISNYVYFVEKGMLRSYYLKNGKETCTWFMLEQDVVFSTKSFYKRLPSNEFIQCIEDTAVYYISHDELNMLYHEFAEFNFVGRILTGNYYLLSEERLFIIRGRTAEESYRYVFEKYPEIIKRVPRTAIASYLGIRLETFNRIRLF